MSFSTDTHKAPTFNDVESSFIKLNDAIIGHSKWLIEWNTRVICGIPVEPPYISETSHKDCFFGRWYYGKHPSFMIQKSEFANLDTHHSDVHTCMRAIVNKTNNKTPVSRDEYKQFVDSEATFSQSLITLRDEIYKLLLSYDHLTGALNRQAFFHILEQEQSRIARFSELGCLVLLDIDKFKNINDNFGHSAGDNVLKTISQFIIENLRPYDSICRYGGEEFLICMPKTTIEQSHVIIDRLREELSHETISISDRKTINVTASFGIAAISDDVELSEAIENADKALYEAKTGGRNMVGIWNEKTDVINSK